VFVFALCGNKLEISVMPKRHPARNSQFIKVIRNVYSFFQEDGLKIKIIGRFYFAQQY
jgi:hypothetical protein